MFSVIIKEGLGNSKYTQCFSRPYPFLEVLLGLLGVLVLPLGLEELPVRQVKRLPDRQRDLLRLHQGDQQIIRLSKGQSAN